METMKSRGTSRDESRKSQISEGGGEQVTTYLEALGDVICIRLRGGLLRYANFHTCWLM